MRLGAPVYGDLASPEAWAEAHRRAGYRAAYCPLKADADDATVRAYAEEAVRADLIIAEVGAWSNPISTDDAERSKALAHCQRQLELAERIGARCCVNIAGSRGPQWDGPHPANHSEETFALIVDTVREIIDAVRPTRTFYALETMPWAPPDSVESYLRLIDAIARPAFAVHLDPCNLVNSPLLYHRNADLIRECFAKLGPFIRSVHGKDVRLAGAMTVHIEEVRPGLGALDWRALLRETDRLHPDTPLMLEHLPGEAEYTTAAAFVRDTAREIGVTL